MKLVRWDRAFKMARTEHSVDPDRTYMSGLNRREIDVQAGEDVILVIIDLSMEAHENA